MTVHKFESSRKTTVEINEYKHIKRKNMKNNPQKKILRQDGFPIGAETTKKCRSSARTITSFLKQLILTILLFTLLPISALATAPGGQVIYVGNENVTSGGYWTTDSDGNVTAYTAGGTPTNNYIHYDAENNVLTLHDATIKKGLDYSEGIQGGTYIPGSAIGVLNLNGDAELTITLAGTNTIEDVSTGIFVLAHSSYTGDASLTITGSGSLTASGNINGINVQSNGGDATLTIQSADVTLTSNSGNGVTVQAGSTNSSGEHTITLSVEGGSLTASGSTGISFDSASSYTVSATNLTVSNNAIVRANYVGSNISNVDLQIGKGNNSSGGIVFDGSTGTVYGTVALQNELTIGEGESLTIPEGTTLTIPQGMTLTNYGTLTSYGTVINQGTLDGNGTITCQHHTGGTATCTQRAKCSLCGTEYGDLAPHTLTKTEAQAPTCTQDGNIDYWTCSVCNKLFRDEAGTQVITEEDTKRPALGHDWGEPVYTWSEDNTACTAKLVCLHDSEHSQTATATVTGVQTQAPSCTEMGITKYTATVEFNGVTYTDIKEITDIPANGHNYVNGTCTVCGADDPDYVEPEPEPEPEPTYYRVDLRPVEGATVILSADEVEEGGTLTFTIEIAEGYVADDLMVTVSQGIGKAVEVKPDEAGVYTVKDVDGLVTITVYGVTEEPATAIERVETLRIYAAEGILHVETPTRQRVTIVSMAGALIADGEQEGARIYRDLNAGIYIVRVGDYATKVRVE